MCIYFCPVSFIVTPLVSMISESKNLQLFFLLLLHSTGFQSQCTSLVSTRCSLNPVEKKKKGTHHIYTYMCVCLEHICSFWIMYSHLFKFLVATNLRVVRGSSFQFSLQFGHAWNLFARLPVWINRCSMHVMLVGQRGCTHLCNNSISLTCSLTNHFGWSISRTAAMISSPYHRAHSGMWWGELLSLKRVSSDMNCCETATKLLEHCTHSLKLFTVFSLVYHEHSNQRVHLGWHDLNNAAQDEEMTSWIC